MRSLTSIMSMTGEPDYGQPTPEALEILVRPAGPTRDEAIEASVAGSKVIASPEHFDEDVARQRAAEAYDRCFNPAGRRAPAARHPRIGQPGRGPRRARRADARDPRRRSTRSSPRAAGERTAELVPGAELLMIEGMGHDLPPAVLGQVVEAITSLAARTHA